MTYVFVFLGEFGYELFNWQAVIRKFSKTIGVKDRIICCSRAQLSPIYEYASSYIDISEVNAFKNSQADGYFAIKPGSVDVCSLENTSLNNQIQSEIRSRVQKQLPSPKRRFVFWKNSKTIQYIFSSEGKNIAGLLFGCKPQRYGKDGNIYDHLALENNLYQRIDPDFTVKEDIQKTLGFPLADPYILVQARTRDVVVRSKAVIPKEDLLNHLSKYMKVVLLSFDTGRKYDSYSRFEQKEGLYHYSCKSFKEQSCLISLAKKCLFFTEGDFGSHIYIPPFMGKDVFAVAPKEVYEIGTTPIHFWNQNVFKFGGQIIPKISENVFRSPNDVEDLRNELIS